MIAAGWSPEVLASLEEAMEPKFLRDMREEERLEGRGGGCRSQRVGEFTLSIDRVSSRLCLRNNVSSQALAPVVIVTLRAGHIELPLAAFEKLTTCIKKGLQAFVDRNLNRNSTRLVGDKRSEGQQLSALEPKRSRILAPRVADVDTLLKINRTLVVKLERGVASSKPTHARDRMAIGARYVRGPILSAPQPFPVQHREHSWIDAVIVLDCPRLRAHEFVIRSLFGGWNLGARGARGDYSSVLQEAKQPKCGAANVQAPHSCDLDAGRCRLSVAVIVRPLELQRAAFSGDREER